MAIRYKVVNQYRKSVFVDTLSRILRYDKGNIVKAHPDSLGIFVFKRKKDAEKFCQSPSIGHNRLILRVETIGKGRSLPIRPTTFGVYDIIRIEKQKKRFLKINQRFKKLDIIIDFCKYFNGYREKDKVILNNLDGLKVLNDGTMVYPAVKVID